MIGTLLRIGFINIRRDRVVQALTFLLPIMFFSIFATVFGNQRNVSERIRLPWPTRRSPSTRRGS